MDKSFYIGNRQRFAASMRPASMFGCTLVFTIPVGMSVLLEEDRPFFLKGLLAGLIIALAMTHADSKA